jgi:uncharacterized protein YodC (DUF2158 family)
MDFQLGDTVQLKSGGPWMTVDHIGPQRQGSDRDAALCSWFVTVKGKQERKNDWFELHSIKKVNTGGGFGEFQMVPGSSIMG